MNLDKDLKEKIELVLDREISEFEQGNVESFSAFSERDVVEIVALGLKSSILAISYIRFRLNGKVSLGQVVSYYSTVIQQGVPVAEWNYD